MALAVERHEFHQIAVAWWEQDESAAIGFCRLTQIGLLRLLTSAAVMKDNVLTNRQAWQVYEQFRRDIRVAFFPEPPTLEDLFQTHATIHQPAPKLWGDAYLAAHAAATGAVLVTFDRGFTKYDVRCLILG
jgi:toxin-antitoxin system PIN domain toxin